MIINVMIREYLEYNRYYNTSSVLIAESGQPVEPPFDKDYLYKKLSVAGCSKGTPIFYEIIFCLKPNDD